MLLPVTDETGAVLLNLPGWLCFQFVGASWAVYESWNTKGEVAEAIRSVLFPVAIGQFVVLLLTVIFQVSDQANPSLIRLDNSLNSFYARYHHWFVFRFWTFAAVVLAVILLNLWFRRAGLVTRFFSAQKYVGIAAAALGTFASFTFAAQYPYAMGNDRDAKVAPRPKDKNEEEEIKKLNRVSAAAVERVFAAMPPATLRRYATLVESIDRDVRWSRRDEVLKQAFDQVLAGEGPHLDATPPAPANDSEPASDGSRTGEAWLGAEKVVSKALSGLVPVPEGTIGELVKSCVEGLSEKLYRSGFRAPVREKTAAMVDQVASWLAPRLAVMEQQLAGAGGIERFVEDQHKAVETEIAERVRREHPRKSAGARLVEERIRAERDRGEK